MHLRSGTRRDHPDELAFRDTLDVAGRGELGEQAQPDGLPEGDEVEHAALALVEGADALDQQVLERGGEGHGTVPFPVTVDGDETLRRTLAVDEVSEPQHVAARRVVQPSLRLGVERAAEGGAQQVRGLVGGERLHLEALTDTVLPDGGDRLRARLAGPDGEDQPDRVLHGELVDQRGGDVVEHVRVVDEQQHAWTLGAQRRTHPGEGGDGAGLVVGVQPGRERPQGHLAGRRGRRRDRHRLLGRRAGDELARQPALAHPGGAGDHDGPVTVEERRDRPELRVASGERPGPHRGGTRGSGHHGPPGTEWGSPKVCPSRPERVKPGSAQRGSRPSSSVTVARAPRSCRASRWAR